MILIIVLIIIVIISQWFYMEPSDLVIVAPPV